MPTNMEVLNKTINVENVIHSRPDVAANYYVLEASQADAKAARAAFILKLIWEQVSGLNSSFSVETFFKPSSLAGSCWED